MSIDQFGRVLFVGSIVLVVSAQSGWAQYGTGMPRMPTSRNNPYNQGNNPAAAAANMQMPLHGSGTVEAVTRGAIKMNLNGNSGVVKLEPKCKIEVNGTADRSFLQPGQLIKFNAEFDKNHKATAPLNELEIVSRDTAMATEGSSSSEKKKDKEAASNSGILGQLTAVKNNELTIQTSGALYKADLGTNPSIKVHVSDYSLAQEGDKVDVDGVMLPQGALASKISIQLTNPLGDSPKKKTPVKAADKSASTK